MKNATVGRTITAVLAALAAFTFGFAAPSSGAPAGEITVEATGGVTSGFSANTLPYVITTGPDGLLWFTENTPTGAARRNADGSISEFTAGFTGDSLQGITAGPDGNIWIAIFNAPGGLARVTPAGVVTEYVGGVYPGLTAGNFEGITAGPDGNVWFTEPFNGRIGRMTPAGVATEFPVPGGGVPRDIVTGPDGNLYITDSGSPGRILRSTTAGVISEVAIGGVTPGFTADSGPSPLTVGPDGNLWFGGVNGDLVGRVTLDGTVTEYAAAGFEAPQRIAASCDSVWLTQSGGDTSDPIIWRVEMDGTMTPYTAGLPAGAEPNGITEGPDGDMWVVDSANPGHLIRVGSGCDQVTPTTTTTSTTTPLPVTPAPARTTTAVATTPAFTG